ncbi:multiprotein bridging factor aMBF1 [Halorutilales archaeon Cl-col2-1]
MQCEMCGAETQDPSVIRIEGSKLRVCSNCEEFGTVLHDETETESQSSSQAESQSQNKSTTSTRSKSSSGGRNRDLFDEIGTLAADYDDKVRNARESKGLSQEDFADEINEKVSLVRKIEKGDMRPDEKVRQKLESSLEIELTEEGVSEGDWSSEGSSDGYTLGDIVERKDS